MIVFFDCFSPLYNRHGWLGVNSGYVVLMAGLNKMYSFIGKQVQETQKQYMLILVLPIDEMIITWTFILVLPIGEMIITWTFILVLPIGEMIITWTFILVLPIGEMIITWTFTTAR